MDYHKEFLSKHKNDASTESPNIVNYLDKISYFEDWDVSLKKECEKFCKIKYFTDGEIILEKDSNTNQFVHFIVRGKAKAIQIIQVNMFNNRNSEHEKTESNLCFIEVFQFSRMSCFNIGEDLHDRTIISSSNSTECLLIPRFWLLEKNKKLWHRMRFFFEHNIPSKDEVEKRFYKRKYFSTHGKMLVEKVVEKSKKSQYNQFFNIPISLRFNQKEFECKE